jgi:hypothetical protein
MRPRRAFGALADATNNLDVGTSFDCRVINIFAVGFGLQPKV